MLSQILSSEARERRKFELFLSVCMLAKGFVYYLSRLASDSLLGSFCLQIPTRHVLMKIV